MTMRTAAVRRAAKRLSWAFAAIAAGGCATPRPPAKPAYDFSKVQRISVHPFQGQGGSAIADEFVRQLVGTRVEVTDASRGGDVILTGIVTEYKPSNTLMVVLGPTSFVTSTGQTIAVSNPVLSNEGVSADGKVAQGGTSNTQIVSVSSTVGVIARLEDPATRAVLWTGTFSYEGLDPAGAMQAVVGYLVRSLERVIPAAGRSTPS